MQITLSIHKAFKMYYYVVASPQEHALLYMLIISLWRIRKQDLRRPRHRGKDRMKSHKKEKREQDKREPNFLSIFGGLLLYFEG